MCNDDFIVAGSCMEKAEWSGNFFSSAFTEEKNYITLPSRLQLIILLLNS